MAMRRVLGPCVILLLAAGSAAAAGSEAADAAMKQNREAVRALLQRKAHVNAPLTSSRDTAVMLAARTGKEDALSVLLEAGARVNGGETWGGTQRFTPLFRAVDRRNLMKERGIRPTTSECTLRGFTCAQANVDPKYATPAEIMKMRALAIGYQVQGIMGALEIEDKK